MSTRCVITVKDESSEYSIYRHHDGYPDGPHGVLSDLNKVSVSGKVWKLPRFEADDFAAGILAELKTSGGGYRMSDGPQEHSDLEYVYTVRQDVHDRSRLHVTIVKASDAYSTEHTI